MDPEECSWGKLCRNGDDEAFMNTVGLNRTGFNLLFVQFRRFYPVKYGTRKGGRPSAVDPCQALGMILQFYATPIDLKTLALLHGVNMVTAYRTLQKAEHALHQALQRQRLARITWPSKEKQKEFAERVEQKYPLIKGRFGFIDGNDIRVKKPPKRDLENGWLDASHISGVLCFSVEGLIIWLKHNFVGAWNDGDMSIELQEKLLDRECCLEEYGIVSDTAFSVSKWSANKIISPLEDKDVERAHSNAQTALNQLSVDIAALRQTCEWGIESIEKVWKRLTFPLPYDQHVRAIRLHNIFRLWNYRVRTTGISPMRNAFL